MLKRAKTKISVVLCFSIFIGLFTINELSVFANGTEESFPQFKNISNSWYVSSDNGETWEPVKTESSVIQKDYVPDGYIGIYTKEDLDNVKNDCSANYILMNDIEYNDTGTICNENFYGVFDGNMYTISNMTSSSPVFKTIGTTGIVRNLIVSFSTLGSSTNIVTTKNSNNHYVHTKTTTSVGFASKNLGLIENVSFSGQVSSSVGLNEDSLATTMAANDELRAYSYSAGFVYTNAGTIKNCRVSCRVSASSNVSTNHSTHFPFPYAYTAGVAYENTSTGTIEDCYFCGNIASATQYSYKVPTTSGTGRNTYSAGIALYNRAGGNIKKCYSLTAGSGNDIKEAIVGENNGQVTCSFYPSSLGTMTTGNFISNDQFSNPDSFTGFDFNSTWIVLDDSEYTYPQLRANLGLYPDGENSAYTVPQLNIDEDHFWIVSFDNGETWICLNIISTANEEEHNCETDGHIDENNDNLCDFCGNSIISVPPVVSAAADKDTAVKGEYITWTVVTAKDVECLKITARYTVNGANKASAVLYKSTTVSSNVKFIEDENTRTWTITQKANYTGDTDSVTQNYTVYYKMFGESAYHAYNDEPIVINVYASRDKIPGASEGYAPYTVVEVTAPETITVGQYGTITIVTTDDCDKVRIGYDNGGKMKYATYQTTTKNNVSYSDADGLRTWIINYKFATGATQYTVQGRGPAWNAENGKTFTVAVA